MSVEAFIDTNLLVYAHDEGSGSKHAAANAVLREVWLTDRSVAISSQVLQELAAQLIRRGADLSVVEELLDVYGAWPVVPGTLHLTRQAVDEMKRWRVSWWDGLILAAAREAGARELWSEDFGEGRNYGGIRAVNPLRKGRKT